MVKQALSYESKTAALLHAGQVACLVPLFQPAGNALFLHKPAGQLYARCIGLIHLPGSGGQWPIVIIRGKDSASFQYSGSFRERGK